LGDVDVKLMAASPKRLWLIGSGSVTETVGCLIQLTG
jgi:hypothetical protein